MKASVTAKHWRDAFPSGLLLFAVPLPSNNTFSMLTAKVCCHPKGRGAPGCWGEHGVPRPAGRRLLLPQTPCPHCRVGTGQGQHPCPLPPAVPVSHQPTKGNHLLPSDGVFHVAQPCKRAAHRIAAQRPCAHLEEEPGFISLIAASLYSSH